MVEVERIISKARERLNRGGAIATGIGVFAAIFSENQILLRRRIEKESLIYGKDLSGKWELPGGTMELADFGEEYQSAFKNVLAREIKEETGLEFLKPSEEIVLLPAVLKKTSIERTGLIDFAFVVPIRALMLRRTNEYQEKLKKGEIQWVPFEEIEKLEIVSERMKYLIDIAIKYILQHL